MKNSLARVALFVLVVLGVFVYIGEVLTRLSGGGVESGGRAASGEISPEAGESLFLGKAKCYTCHSVGDQGSAIRGPNLGEPGPLGMPIGLRAEERARERSTATGKTYSATDYLLESMIDPNAYLVEGYRPEMPIIIRPPIALGGPEVQAVVAYLQSVGGEGDSVPVEQSPFWQQVAAGAAEAEMELFKPYIAGDPEKGRALFFSEEATGCTKCHQVNGVGRMVGPDLSSIAATRSVQYIVESILDPGAQIAGGFETTVVTLLDWNEVVGVMTKETDEVLEIMDSTGEVHSIPKADIDEIVVDPGSPMPANFAELVTVSEFHDLLAYVLTLTGEAPDAEEIPAVPSGEQ